MCIKNSEGFCVHVYFWPQFFLEDKQCIFREMSWRWVFVLMNEWELAIAIILNLKSACTKSTKADRNESREHHTPKKAYHVICKQWTQSEQYVNMCNIYLYIYYMLEKELHMYCYCDMELHTRKFANRSSKTAAR